MYRRQINDCQSYQSTPRSKLHLEDNLKIEKPIFSEWKLATLGLLLSLGVIITKVIYAYQNEIKNFVIEKKLGLLVIEHEDGEIMYKHAWMDVVKYSHIWLPALCGFLTTYFTWLMVYLDSNVPGVQPPSPFSPTKYKMKSGHSFHLNYVFAVLVGILVSVYMYWRGVNIEYYTSID